MSVELQPIRELRSDLYTLLYSRDRRAANKAARRCINHNEKPAQIGVRCADCAARHLGLFRLLPSHRAHLMALRLVRELRAIAND